jgi:hypothetical protein
MDEKNNEPPTACMKNSGFSAKSQFCTFNKSQCQIENEVLFNPPLRKAENRYASALKNPRTKIVS